VAENEFKIKYRAVPIETSVTIATTRSPLMKDV
jgi:hypothetical protein